MSEQQRGIRPLRRIQINLRLGVIIGLGCLTLAEGQTCSTDTGGTCQTWWPCDSSRNAVCINAKCMCTNGMCADASGICSSGDIEPGCPADTGTTCLFYCDASRNASCVTNKCVCTGDACSDGRGVCVSGPTSAPTSHAPTSTPTAYNGNCHDLTIPNAAGGQELWAADKSFAIFSHFTCLDISNGYLGAVSPQIVVDSVKMIPIEFVRSTSNSLTDSDPSSLIKSVAGAVMSGFLPIFQLQTDCVKDQMTNTLQAAKFSVTPTSAVQACCVCGGGSGSTRVPDSETIAALRDFYHSTGGETWTNAYGVT